MLTSFLQEHPEVTAICCANDIVALNAYRVIHNMGKRIPDDYSIIGFDNVANGRYASPSLSTFNVPREQIGDEIGLYIIRIKQDNKLQFSELIIRCDYIERDSVKKLN